jgi:hypothetical protein
MYYFQIFFIILKMKKLRNIYNHFSENHPFSHNLYGGSVLYCSPLHWRLKRKGLMRPVYNRTQEFHHTSLRCRLPTERIHVLPADTPYSTSAVSLSHSYFFKPFRTLSIRSDSPSLSLRFSPPISVTR